VPVKAYKIGLRSYERRLDFVPVKAYKIGLRSYAL
jgi:hypothetical protein